MVDNAPDGAIGSVLRAFDILERMLEQETVSVTELADELDAPKSTVHAYLATLDEAGFVVNEGGSYRLGLRFLEYGGLVRNRSKLYEVAKHEVDKLAAETGEVANLGVEEEGLRVLLYKSAEPDAIHDNASVGEFTHMHWTALGKAILAYLPEERVQQIIDTHGLPRANEHTIENSEALFDELARTRERGYSVEDQDRRQGVLTVGAPIFDRASNEVIASISVSGPRERLRETTTVEELADQVKSAANVVELRYTHY
jgi:DNA-binding IclR family transcriptional regulator